MKILIIGGTGAMGEPLTEYLSKASENTVYVIARHPKESPAENVIYLQGDANDFGFFVRTLSQGFDVIVDFMVWMPKVLKQRLDIIFTSCDQYIGMSSSAVYADSNEPLAEDFPKLFDRYSNAERKQTYRYHIRKSVTDNIIMNSPCQHWTLARPSLTFNKGKLTLLGFQKETWLWRCLNGHTVVIPRDVLDKKTTLTYGGDAALAISKLVGNKKALGQVVNVASDKWTTQGELLQMYRELLPEIYGKEFKIQYIPDASSLWIDFPQQYDIYTKDRCLNRIFSTEKLMEISGERIEFGNLRENLKLCIEQTLNDPDIELMPNIEFNAWMDRITHEHMPLKGIADRKERRKYMIFRNSFSAWMFRKYRNLKDKRFRYVYKKR